MPKYACFDSAAPAPSPVLGWYDTDRVRYAKLPAAVDLLVLTYEQWLNRLGNPSGWAVSNGALVAHTPTVATATLAQQARAALAAGVTVTSVSTPALDGTYACDPSAQHKIAAVSLFITVNGRFPGGAATLAWPDATGTARVFPTTALFQAFATAVADHVAALDAVALGVTTVLPGAPAPLD